MLTVLAQSQRSNVQEALEGNNTDLKYHTRGSGDDVDGKELFSRLVHAVEGDGRYDVHLGPGDLRQVLGVEDQAVRRSLSSRTHHDGQQHTCTTFSQVILLLTQHTTRHMQISSVCSFIHVFIFFLD